MSMVLLVMTDGRDDLLEETIDSARCYLRGDFSRRIIHTDNGQQHRKSLASVYPGFEVIGGERLGFGGAIDRAWKSLAECDRSFVFHLEDDFIFNRVVSLDDMGSVLNRHPYLAQMALRRQPWSDEEKTAGGVVECWPDEYEECEWNGHRWLEHRLWWTTNPSLYRSDRCADGWPVCARSEAFYGAAVMTDPRAKFGYWGARDSGEWVRHIGEQRAGVNY